MTVRKKLLTDTQGQDMMALSSRLTQVREAITNLPKENEMPETATATKPAKKVPAKKVAAAPAKKNGAAAAPAAIEKATDMITLSEICQGLKIEPRLARRQLRASDIEVESGRWEFKIDSAQHKAVVKLLTPAKE